MLNHIQCQTTKEWPSLCRLIRLPTLADLESTVILYCFLGKTRRHAEKRIRQSSDFPAIIKDLNSEGRLVCFNVITLPMIANMELAPKKGKIKATLYFVFMMDLYYNI